jgi:hypothetical protein
MLAIVSISAETIARRAGQLVGKAANEAEDQWSLALDGSGRMRRAFRRIGWSAIGWFPLLICLLGPPSDRTAGNLVLWLLAMVVSGFVLFLFLRHYGGDAGLRGGAVLWSLSAGIAFGLALIAWAALNTVLLLAGDATVGVIAILAFWFAGTLVYGVSTKLIDRAEACAA